MHDTVLSGTEPPSEEVLSVDLSDLRLSSTGLSTIQSAILQPINTDDLPEARSDEPLFLPADAQRRWYLGYLHHWKDYQRHAIKDWESAGFKKVLHELKECAVDGPRSAATTGDEHDSVGGSNTGSAKLGDKFRREVAEIVEIVYNHMLTTPTMRGLNAHRQPEHILLRKAGSESKDMPRFWFRAKPVGRSIESKSRLTGHVEYLGGKPGALKWAVGEVAKNSWGSLRCVLGRLVVFIWVCLLTVVIGDIAWCMLKTDTNYGFVLSSDEIMFLRFDISTCVEEVDINRRNRELLPRFEWVDVLEEPHLFYSDPIKFTDAFDSAEGKITARQGLLHLIHEVVTKGWKMQDRKGKCTEYFQMAEAGQKWVSKPPRRR
jgi:hypothetical protein